ncbi:hypothetical protein [Rhizobium oryzicola]|uniref:Uncharacterized protein n=1 Tax=Rhizobium oryzicola TaxID=1232668 RepID=A0ABT8SZC3_9HYPH|nr:hypothetical protein [Rhizobium oryzicola]MDO1583625.1 hypothetical protein [Rhizobium oryzicola]
MVQHIHGTDDPWEPSLLCRFTVEAAMLDMVKRLQKQGLGNEEIAVSLADAAEDYVIRLANALCKEGEPVERPSIEH